METRRLGSSELYPSVIGFGAWAAGRNGWGPVEEKEIRLAINWLLYNKAVTTVIAGAKTVAQLQENAAAARWKLAREDYEQISRLFEPDSSYVI
ncbi:aldo/keto reductase [Paenibacillus glycanilyticus]|uniref:aldo/keto reductase n=1 Tax=Paenibacillus glycanilyticus TaxID=126569 RepID=UPI00203BBBEF|nr:aldo/keto reductase [Paenibacillus glycanilyticus]MCM3627985.1 aldo/keto reductase [Paenibacillus glycanilyticus]